jgi:nicotinamidase-related amidase
MLLDSARSALLVVDLQERLLPAIDGAAACLDRVRILIRAARALSVPVTVTEQYPKGLGHTTTALGPLLDGVPVLEKLHFSAAAEPRVRAHLAGLGRDMVVICGTESHVCVLQSAFGLADSGFTVFVVADAVASRAAENRALALERLRAGGIEVVTTEMVVFEWLQRAGTPQFREVSRLIR